jgi:hypothetical protein
VYSPDEEVDFNKFVSQKNELRKIVFDEFSKPVGNEHITFGVINEKNRVGG